MDGSSEYRAVLVAKTRYQGFRHGRDPYRRPEAAVIVEQEVADGCGIGFAVRGFVGSCGEKAAP